VYVVVDDVSGTYGTGPLTLDASFGQSISVPVCVLKRLNSSKGLIWVGERYSGGRGTLKRL